MNAYVLAERREKNTKRREENQQRRNETEKTRIDRIKLGHFIIYRADRVPVLAYRISI